MAKSTILKEVKANLNPISAKVKLLLMAIENTIKNKLSLEDWKLIIRIIRNIGINHFNDANYYLEEVLDFTKRAYKEDELDDVVEKANGCGWISMGCGQTFSNLRARGF